MIQPHGSVKGVASVFPGGGQAHRQTALGSCARVKQAVYSSDRRVKRTPMRSILKMPEYGPMNRSMLRALNLAAAGTSFPDHPEAHRWLKMGAHIFADSLDKWSMEDSVPYREENMSYPTAAER